MTRVISDQLAVGLKLRKESKLEESRKLFLDLSTSSPDHPQVNYQCAWAHDVLGLEHEAIPFYERAIEQGLNGEDLRGAIVGLGSSYRCVGEHSKAAEILRRGAEKFPSSRNIRIFLSMALHSLGEHGEAIELLLKQLAETTSDPGIMSYRKAILHYADEFGQRDDQSRAKDCSILPTKGGYNRWAKVYDLDGNALTALEEPIVRKLLGDVKGLKVADIGCGTGRHALHLATQGAEVSAVDFSEGMLDKAKSKPDGKAVKFIYHDVTKLLPFANSAFDRVLSCLVLEHIKDIDSFFRELGRICRRDGFVVISAMHPAMWLKGQSARFFDATTNQEIRPRSYPQQISDYVTAATRAGLLIDHISEHAPDDELARRLPRAQKHIGWPMLIVMRLRQAS